MELVGNGLALCFLPGHLKNFILWVYSIEPIDTLSITLITDTQSPCRNFATGEVVLNPIEEFAQSAFNPNFHVGRPKTLRLLSVHQSFFALLLQ